MTIQGLHHLVLFFRDAEAARDWYQRVGFEYRRGYEGMHWFALGNAEVMLHPADRGSGGTALAIHAAVSDVDGLFRRVVQAGLAPFDHQNPAVDLREPVVRPWGDREFELEDPEGHRWAFTQSP